MRYYQPIGQVDKKWTNFDADYFENFEMAKEYIRKKSQEKECQIYGLDVFDRKKDEYLNMFWRLEPDGSFSRDYHN